MLKSVKVVLYSIVVLVINSCISVEYIIKKGKIKKYDTDYCDYREFMDVEMDDNINIGSEDYRELDDDYLNEKYRDISREYYNE